jgi:hypothetical protein
MDNSKGKKYSMLYVYDGSEKVEQRYMRNDKIAQVWDFTCKPEGVRLLDKTKAVVCEIREDNEDGSYVESKREEKDGKVYLNKYYFTKDADLYKSEGYLNDSLLQWKGENDGSTYYFESYDKKGNVAYTRTTKFDNDMRLVYFESSWDGSEKHASSAKYVYNENGTLAEKVTTYKQKITGHETYKYIM